MTKHLAYTAIGAISSVSVESNPLMNFTYNNSANGYTLNKIDYGVNHSCGTVSFDYDTNFNPSGVLYNDVLRYKFSYGNDGA